eukprot:CAMPEP_0170527224 /NCGR_PEP_ID=MMETSP0209-20121228/12691_1 /TAXON_ID=665100 ORGANISM="Litonotus pictus, Strain P1" /NCGR_SAMPLE_ID=MMETSP0209 /ASSEMBLY_ACC=CAM_ASM_000301 /LENGTH=2613 /DNA_ID=CAMNT_0010817613 /DNA_START=128 /DNA_END=7969 /DNA_ORIENTATION=+
MIKIRGYFECNCGEKNHEILRKPQIYDKNFERFQNKDTKCFYSYFDLRNELKIYKKDEDNRLCEICMSKNCSKTNDPEKDKKVIERNHAEYHLIENKTETDTCTCKAHYEPNFISIYDEFTRESIRYKKFFLNFNINFLFKNKVFIDNVVAILLTKVQDFSDLGLTKHSAERKEMDTARIKEIKRFYKDFHLLNTISFIRKIIEVYSKRNDTTTDVFSKEYKEYMEQQGTEINFKIHQPIQLLELLELRLETDQMLFEEYSTYFLIKFSFLYLLHDIHTVGFIKSTCNTLNSNEILNLSFFQRYIYLQKSQYFFYLSKNEDAIDKYRYMSTFIEKFTKVINEEMESFLNFMNYSKNANIIFTEKTFQIVIESYINAFHWLIKYNLIMDDEEIKKFYSHCFDLLVLSINFYSTKEKERNDILRNNNELKKIEEIDRLEEKIIRFKEGQNYIFTLVRSIFFFLVNKNDEVFTYHLQNNPRLMRNSIASASNIAISHIIKNKDNYNKKFVHEKNQLCNLAARVFSVCIYHYLMITYKETNSLKKFTDKIATFDYYAKHIFEFLCDDSQNYLRSLDIHNLDFNNCFIDFLDDADHEKLNFKKENFLNEKETRILMAQYTEKYKNTEDSSLEIDIMVATDHVNQSIDLINQGDPAHRGGVTKIVDAFEAINNQFFDFQIDFEDYFSQIEDNFKKFKSFLEENNDLILREGTKKNHALVLFSYYYQIMNEFFQIACVGLTKIKKPDYEFHHILDIVIDIFNLLIKGCYSNTVMILQLDTDFLCKFVEKAFNNYLALCKSQDHRFALVHKYFEARIEMFYTLSVYSKSVCMSCLNNFISFIETIDFHLDYIIEKHKKKVGHRSSGRYQPVSNNPNNLGIENSNSNYFDGDEEEFDLDEFTMIILTKLFLLYKEMIRNCSNENIEIYDGFESFQIKLEYFKPKLTYKKVMSFLFKAKETPNIIRLKSAFLELFDKYIHMMSVAFECDFYLFGLIKKKYYLFDIDNYNYIAEFHELIATEKKSTSAYFYDIPGQDEKKKDQKDLLLIHENAELDEDNDKVKEQNKSKEMNGDLIEDGSEINERPKRHSRMPSFNGLAGSDLIAEKIINLPLNLLYNISRFYYFFNKGKFKFSRSETMINKYNNTFFNRVEEKKIINAAYSKTYKKQGENIPDMDLPDIKDDKIAAENDIEINEPFDLEDQPKDDKEEEVQELHLLDEAYKGTVLSQKVISAKKEFDLRKNEFLIDIEEDDDTYTLKKKLLEMYKQTKDEELLKRANSESEDIFLYYRYLQYNEDNIDLAVLMNEFSIKVIEKNMYFNLEYFIYKVNTFETKENQDTTNNFIKLYKYYQNVIIRQMFYIVNFYIVHKRSLKGNYLDRLHNNLILFVKATSCFYNILEPEESKLFFLKEKKVIKADIEEPCKKLIKDYYDQLLNEKIKFYEIDELFAVYKTIFAIVFDKVASNSDAIDTFKSRYFTFEKTYYKQYDNDHRTIQVQQQNIDEISKFLQKLHLKGYRSIYYDTFMSLRENISNTFNDNLSIIKCFDFNDLANKEFLPESCFFYLLNKIFDNSSFTSIKYSEDGSKFIARSLNEGFGKVSQETLKIHNSYAIRLIRNLVFNDIERFQKVFIKHFDKSKNGVRLLQVMAMNYIFPFAIYEFSKILEFSYYDKKNSSSYDLVVSTLNLFQHLCESSCKNNQNLFFSMEIKPIFEGGDSETSSLDFIKYSFVNFLFKLLTTCYKVINFEDLENHRFQNSFFKSNSPQQRIFSRITDFILEVSNGFEEGKSSIYFYNNIKDIKQIEVWMKDQKRRLKKNLASENGRFDLLGNFSTASSNLDLAAMHKDSKIEKGFLGTLGISPKKPVDGEEVLEPQGSPDEGRDEDSNNIYKWFKKNMAKNLIAYDERADNIQTTSYFQEVFEFKFMTLVKHFKYMMLKYGYHNEKNNVIVYNFLRIIYSLLIDEAIYEKFITIISPSLLSNLSYSYLKFVYIRNVIGKEYDDRDFPLLLNLVPVINEKVFYDIYFNDQGKTYNDIYFIISYNFYMLILLFETKYENIDAKLLLSFDSKKMEKHLDKEDEFTKEVIMGNENAFVKSNIWLKDSMNVEYIRERVLESLYEKKRTNKEKPMYFIQEVDTNFYLANYPNFQHSCRIITSDSHLDLMKKLEISENKSLNEFYLNRVMGQVEFKLGKDNDQGSAGIDSMIYIKNPDLTYFNNIHLTKFYNYHSEHDDATAKINSLLDFTGLIIAEVDYYIKEIKPNSTLNFLWINFSFYWNDMISLAFTTAIMTLLLSTLKADNIDEDSTDKYYYVVLVLAIIQVVLNLTSIIIFMYLRYPLEVLLSKSKYLHQQMTFKWFFIYLYDSIISNQDINYTLFNLVVGIVGALGKKFTFLYSLQLFTFNKTFLILHRIVQAFQTRFVQLANMVFLLVIFIYFYSNMGFYYLSDQFWIYDDNGKNTGESKCPNLIACFIRHFDFGQRADGGISDDLQSIPFNSLRLFYDRFFYDMIFFICVRLLLLNMINGVIVSTFSELRENDDKKKEDRKYKCFICSIHKKEFDKQNVDYEEHTTLNHSVIQYVNYIIKLRLMSAYDLTYKEKTILDAFKDRKVDVFPLYKTSDLPNYVHQDEDEEED